MRVLVAAIFLFIIRISNCAEFGAADFSPTREQPFGWRGDGTGKFTGATPLLSWNEKNVKWTATVGRSFSSPILTADSVLALSEPNILVCINRADGKERWRTPVTAAGLPGPQREKAEAYVPKKDGARVAAATPITDGKTIYVVLGSGIVCALDLDGNQKWTAYIDAEEATMYGRSSSPLIVGGKLIVHMTNLYAFDLDSGKQLWVNTKAKSTYGTPARFVLNGAELIITPAGDVVRAADGTLAKDGIGTAAGSSPVVNDGVIHFAEKEVRAVKLGADFKPEEIWSGEITGEVFGSPLIHGGLLFNVTSTGDLFVFDATKRSSQTAVIEGRSLYEGGSGSIFASLTLAGKHIFLTTNSADFFVLEATNEAKIAAKFEMKEGSPSGPIFSGKNMYYRDGDKLICVGE